jgi:hypothetical protein
MPGKKKQQERIAEKLAARTHIAGTHYRIRYETGVYRSTTRCSRFVAEFSRVPRLRLHPLKSAASPFAKSELARPVT